LFLLQVDILSTIYVKSKTNFSQGKPLKGGNSDILKYAVEKYKSICEACETIWQQNNKSKLEAIDQDIESQNAKLRAEDKVRH
jgi:hypothetical protein